MTKSKKQQSPTFWDVGAWRPEIRQRSSSVPAALEWYDPVAVARYSPTFRVVSLERDTGERKAIRPAPPQGIRRTVLTQQWGSTLTRGGAMATLVGGLLMAGPVATAAAQSLDPPPPARTANNDFLERLIRAIGEDSPLWQFVSPEDGSALWRLIERVGPDSEVWDLLRQAGPDHAIWERLAELGADNPIWDEILPDGAPGPSAAGLARTGQPIGPSGVQAGSVRTGLPIGSLGVQAGSPLGFVKRTGAANPLGDAVVGDNPAPAFVDIDGDGDFDAFIGSSYISGTLNIGAGYDSVTQSKVCIGIIQFFENLDIDNGGGYGYAHFVERTDDDNPFSGKDLECNPKPAFVDIDDEGDFDAFVGVVTGTIKYFRNDSTPTDLIFTEQIGANNPLSVTVGYSSAPSFVDIDDDGDFDAFIGQSDGGVHFFENLDIDNGAGSGQPDFVERFGAANPLDLVHVGDNSTPTFADIDGDGDFDAFVGNKLGTISFFENLDPCSGGKCDAPSFVERTGDDNPLGGAYLSNHSTPDLVDIDGDGDFDAFSGADYFPILIGDIGDILDGGEYDPVTRGKGAAIHFFEAITPRPVGGATEPFSPLQTLGPWVASAAVGVAGAIGAGSALLRRKRRQS